MEQSALRKTSLSNPSPRGSEIYGRRGRKIVKVRGSAQLHGKNLPPIRRLMHIWTYRDWDSIHRVFRVPDKIQALGRKAGTKSHPPKRLFKINTFREREYLFFCKKRDSVNINHIPGKASDPGGVDHHKNGLHFFCCTVFLFLSVLISISIFFLRESAKARRIWS